MLGTDATLNAIFTNMDSQKCYKYVGFAFRFLLTRTIGNVYVVE